RIPVIDVISNHHLSAAVTHWPLLAKLRSRPILVERHCHAHAHGEDATACRIQTSTSHPDDPVAYGGSTANVRLAGGKSADAVKRVWSETKIPIHNIDVAARHSQQLVEVPE